MVSAAAQYGWHRTSELPDRISSPPTHRTEEGTEPLWLNFSGALYSLCTSHHAVQPIHLTSMYFDKIVIYLYVSKSA